VLSSPRPTPWKLTARPQEKELYEKLTTTGRKWALALEFIERDKAENVKTYLKNESGARPLFSSETEAARYAELVETAKLSGNNVVAANAPRRLVSRVTKGGPLTIDSLEEAERKFLPPLPYRWAKPISKAYESRLMNFWSSSSSTTATTTTPSGGGSTTEKAPTTTADSSSSCSSSSSSRRQNLMAAQCLWDATMAHSVLDSLFQNDAVFLVCGRFHVEYFLGIVDHIEYILENDERFQSIQLDRHEFRLLVAVPLPAADFDAQELTDWAAVRHDPRVRALADFVIFTRED